MSESEQLRNHVKKIEEIERQKIEEIERQKKWREEIRDRAFPISIFEIDRLLATCLQSGSTHPYGVKVSLDELHKRVRVSEKYFNFSYIKVMVLEHYRKAGWKGVRIDDDSRYILFEKKAVDRSKASKEVDSGTHIIWAFLFVFIIFKLLGK